MIIFIYTIIGVTLWTIFGLGATTAEKQGRKSTELNRMTIVFWPAALITWAVYGEV